MTRDEIEIAAEAYADNYDFKWDGTLAYRAFVAGAQANTPKWIPVSQQMPERENESHYLSEDVLFTDGANVFTGWYHFKTLYWHEGGRVIHDVSHWMPLPSPPNKES